MPKARISETTREYIDKHRGKKSQGQFIASAIEAYKKHPSLLKKIHELELEVEKLTSSLLSPSAYPTSEETIQARKRRMGKAPELPKCPALVFHDGIYYCFKNAPNAKSIKSLDFCEAHLKWFKIAEKLTRDYSYTTCGAEQIHGEDGFLWLKCPLDHERLHKWEDCRRVACKHVKTVKAERK